MQFALTSDDAAARDSECVILGVFEDGSHGDGQGSGLHGPAAAVDKASGGRLSSLAEAGDLATGPGDYLWLHGLDGVSAGRVLVMGCGKADKFNDERFRKITLSALRLAAASPASTVTSYLTELDVDGRDRSWCVYQTAMLAAEATYRYSATLTEPNNKKHDIDELAVYGDDEQSLQTGAATGAGADLTRELGNLPPNICDPSYLAEQAEEMAKRHKKITTCVLGRAEMKKAGMGSLLSVAAGSTTEPKLIIIQYSNAGDSAPVALVGKGVTFDTGGISLKPGAAMDEMKFDMCGAASVFGTLEACARLELPINVVGVIPATDNMPDGSATHPGDIVKSMSGLTIEVLNTDAEGRLILCDALTYVGRFKPSAVVDIATLTGACVIALGKHTSGVMGNDQLLVDELLDAGIFAFDRAWQLPLFDAYQEQLKTPFADMANVGGKAAGSITAGCFLSRFSKDYKWAHLDIAGTAWRSNEDKGATGRPVPLLVQFLVNRAAAAA